MQNRPDIWIWTEPLAFDNEAEDCGVAAYFDAMGFDFVYLDHLF